MMTTDTRKERILIVDDTPANIDVLGAILMQEYDISVAVNGPMALDILSSTPPDLILLDIMMPGMDGYEVARRIKSDERTAKIPVIFVTAKSDEEDEATGFDVGAVDYIRKPVNSAVTLARIKSQLELKRYRDRLTRMVAQKTCQVASSRQALAQEKKKLDQTAKTLESSRESARRNQAYFRELFMNSPHGIILVGPDNRIINANKSFANLVGYTPSDIINRETGSFSVNPSFKDEHKTLILEALNRGSVSMETQCFHRSGFQIHVSAMAFPVKIDDRVQGVFIFYENISQRKLFEEKLKHQAFHDALTGIPNRLLFSERLDCAIEKSKTDSDFKFAVLLIDLDRFKSINDSLGHQAGDTLLQLVTGKIRRHLRSQDTMARLGGDEFAVLLADIRDKAEVETIAARIRKAAESVFTIEDHDVRISASIGIVFGAPPYENANQMIRDADLAMYHAKDSGRAQFKFFSARMHEALMTSVTYEAQLRKAMEEENLMLHYQPIVRVDTGRLEGFEALIRWPHPDRGMIPPDQFIPIAEETGLILPLSDWIINAACQKLAQWHKTYHAELTMNINISVRHFLEPGFVDGLVQAVKAAGISSSDIKLEFTESLLMEHTRSAVEKMETLRHQGFSLVIDDFGTGYSCLSYLQQFPIDQIKIDRSFVRAMDSSEESLEIVKSILSLCRCLGLASVAEGVETAEQAATLGDLGCEKAQGYYYARPTAPDEMAPMIWSGTLPFSR